MEFNTNIHDLLPPRKFKVDLVGMKLPNNKDIFFRAKQQEIIEQYEAARSFLHETDTDDWEHWFTSDEKHQPIFELIFTSHFFQSALMFYNIVVDLSWTLCYVSAEYVVYEKDQTINFAGMLPIEDAYKALRKAENIVTNPHSQDNPFEYLKKMCPEFGPAIDLIIDFWKEFSDSNIRGLYNFIKHKGKPNFDEIEAFRQGKIMGMKIGGEEYPTDIREVQRQINLKTAIDELRSFDDTTLFPYIKTLFQLLEDVIKPSPIIF